MAGQGGLAEEVRTGLNFKSEVVVTVNNPADPLNELWFRKPVRRHICEFGAVLAIVLLLFALISCWKGNLDTALALFICAAVLYELGLRAPRLMLPVWRSFIRLGELLGHIVTFMVLLLTWTIALLPLALGMRVFGAKVMNMGFRMPVESYWENRDPAKDDFKLLERQY